ncbi:DUF5677 domain-containing protein [Flavobacterium frigoris]|uniref:Uncharacterized protein n=1 Tax=Flavobacterium frigoris (strain PS1) TaxID=1086011 RepID=H7FVM1_FLAFP|nr:DUF5677 domain-containing protein [Flavobacterium frigoris]EIA07443.1 hypothetical protein HJ01_03246 [Flavobacterium frigoris PS1]
MNEQLPRELTDSEISFLEELELYNKVLCFIADISICQGGIDADGRGVRGMKIFTRQTVIAFSLSRIFPKPQKTTSYDTELWDVLSIASITRNLVEGYLALHYFGLEKISDDEAELRFLILQLHRNIEWFNIRKIEEGDEEYKEFFEGIINQKKQIKNHPYLNNLSVSNRNKALKFSEMYRTKSDFENSLPICNDLIKIYRLLSNLVHPLPMSIERIDNENGRGIGSEMDIQYCIQCILLARRFLAATVVDIVDFFSDSFVEFSERLEEIRYLQFKGFEIE